MTTRNQFFQEAFEGYTVPENIKTISKEICKRFAIIGICDPMYISNVIATENNIGNGAGTFTGNEITEPIKTAERIQSCYGCNILKSEISEIEFCLMNGYMDSNKAITGLKEFGKRTKQEMKTCDEWRIDYLERVLNNIEESIEIYSK